MSPALTDTALIDIGPLQLGFALLFVLLAQAGSLVYRLGLAKDLTVGAVRTFVQLFLMGFALRVIFDLDMHYITMGVFSIMLIMAADIIKGRVKEKDVPFAVPMFFAMLSSYFVVTVMVTGVIIGAKPWWEARYFIPLGGMIIGNSMNSLAVGLDRLFSDLRAKRELVEMRLSLGADYREASKEIVADAIRAGMIPSINSMMGVGIVFIPGMMTGQILAGADPLTAIKYQIVVMLMLVGSTAIGSMVVILLVRKRCFGPGQRLLPRPDQDR
jgi:putative ABC transport system permease protein